MKRYGIMGICGLMIAMILACGSSNSHNPSPPPSPANGKVLFAVYMVGSDLETDENFATGDLLDMIDGYAQLDAVGKESLEVLVAFGGSLKPTWNGVRYADMDCLVQDGIDGVFGNDHCYSYEAVFAQLYPHADYLVGSQELEPGHGWDYSLLLPAFTADAQAFARRAVDTFIDSEQHIGTSGKTLSVVDTTFYPAFLASLDDLAVDLRACIHLTF